jgi:hypothetical protein
MEYIFNVSRDSGSETAVTVGITAQERNWPPENKLLRDDIIEAAGGWLRSCLEKGKRDPFNRPETDKVLLVPQGTLDHWRTDRSFQDWPC